MSTGLNCDIIQTGGRWYYILESGDAPKLAADWYDYAYAWGPFGSEAAALQHLHTHHANPGGYSTYDVEKPGEKLQALLAEARR